MAPQSALLQQSCIELRLQGCDLPLRCGRPLLCSVCSQCGFAELLLQLSHLTVSFIDSGRHLGEQRRQLLNGQFWRALTIPMCMCRCGPWADADAELRRVARHYGQPNVSPYAALREEVWSGRLAVADVVQDDDCLHPAGSRGARGARYIADMLEHCFDTARAAVGASSDKALLGARGVVANPHRDARREAAAELVLPAALHPEYERAGKYEASSCYLLGEQRGVNAQRRARLPWRTGRCTAAAAEPRASELCVTLPSRRQCPGWGSTQQQYDRFLATPPGDFFECNYALSPNASSRKVSEGLTALASGAVLDLGPLPAMRPPSMLAALEYLTSYSSTMGVARVTCLGGCACASHNINAREVGAAGERNVSVWREAELRILLPNV